MHLRVNGHREIFKEILKRAADNTLQDLDTNNDLYTLGLHLYFEHGITDEKGFDRFVKFGLLEAVNPVDIEVKEYKWIDLPTRRHKCWIPVWYSLSRTKITALLNDVRFDVR